MTLRTKLIYKRWKFKEGADFTSSRWDGVSFSEDFNPKMNFHHEIEGYYPKPKPKDLKPDYLSSLLF